MNTTLPAQLAKARRENPPMSREEERAVAERARRGDAKARDRLILCNIGIATTEALKWTGHYVLFDDLMQYGLEGLCRAADTYRPATGNRFSTYAHWWVRAFIQRNVALKESTLRRGSQYAKRGLAAIRIETTSIDDVAEPLSGTASPEEDSVRRGQRVEIGRRLWRMGLDARERDIVESRLMAEDPQTYGEIGLRHGVCRERIRQIEIRLRERLQRVFADLAA